MLAWVRRDAEKEETGRPRQVLPGLGGSYAEQDSEDEDVPPRRRNMSKVYAFAPLRADEELDDGDDEEALELDRRAQQISDEDADAHWARLEAQVRAMFAGEDVQEENVPAPLAEEERSSVEGREAPDAPAERPPAPDVSRTSSTSEPLPSFPRKRESSAPSEPAVGGEYETGGGDGG